MSILPPDGPIQDSPCPFCGLRLLRIEMRLEEVAIGTDATGVQEWPWMVCDGCSAEARGQYFDNEGTDDGQ